MTHRRDVEGLRAVAVLAVLLYHFGVPGVGGGYVGVDVFFVISGFLITSLLVADRTDTGRVSFATFYARRARRLLPISTVVLVATVFASMVWLPTTRLPDVADDVKAAAMFAVNLLFAHRGTDYLTAGLDPSPLQHYWSLAVEEQFYMLWPALIAAVTIGARNVRRRTTWAMGTVVAASFLASALLTAEQPSWSYFGLHTRAWELGVGALLACAAPTIVRWPANLRAALGWLGLAGVGTAVAVYGDVITFPGWAAALPVLATAAVIAAGDDAPRGPTVLLRHRPFQVVGARSYSLYLWHWPALIIAEGHLLRPLSATEKVAVAGLVVMLAEIGFRFVENPVRRSRRLAARPAMSMLVGATLVGTSALGGVALATHRAEVSTGVVATTPALPTSTLPTTTTDVPDSAPATDAVTTSTLPQPPAPIDMHGLTAIPAVVEALATVVAPDNLRPGLGAANGDVPPIYDSGCHQFSTPRIRTDCTFGPSDAGVTIALWGDSHAAQWFTPLATMASANGWRLLSLTQGSCSFLDITVYDRKNHREFGNCAPWRDAVRQYLRDEGVDVLFVSQHYGLLDADTQQAISPQRWADALPAFIDALRADGIEPVVIGDSPNPPTTVPDCVAERRRHTDECGAPQYDRDDLAVAEAIRAATSAARVGFVEPGEWMCGDDGRCPAIIGDILVYRDNNHLSETAAAWLSPLFEATVAPFVRDWVAYAVSR